MNKYKSKLTLKFKSADDTKGLTKDDDCLLAYSSPDGEIYIGGITNFHGKT